MKNLTKSIVFLATLILGVGNENQVAFAARFGSEPDVFGDVDANKLALSFMTTEKQPVFSVDFVNIPFDRRVIPVTGGSGKITRNELPNRNTDRSPGDGGENFKSTLTLGEIAGRSGPDKGFAKLTQSANSFGLSIRNTSQNNIGNIDVPITFNLDAILDAKLEFPNDIKAISSFEVNFFKVTNQNALDNPTQNDCEFCIPIDLQGLSGTVNDDRREFNINNGLFDVNVPRNSTVLVFAKAELSGIVETPEPLTIIASSLAIGFGVLCQREYAKKHCKK